MNTSIFPQPSEKESDTPGTVGVLDATATGKASGTTNATDVLTTTATGKAQAGMQNADGTAAAAPTAESAAAPTTPRSVFYPQKNNTVQPEMKGATQQPALPQIELPTMRAVRNKVP